MQRLTSAQNPISGRTDFPLAHDVCYSYYQDLEHLRLLYKDVTETFADSRGGRTTAHEMKMSRRPRRPNKSRSTGIPELRHTLQ